MAGATLSTQVVGASVRGATHVRAGLPNQDAMTWQPPSGKASDLVVAVSDGHGSEKSFRSGQGARTAVDIAARLVSAQVGGWAGLPLDHVHDRLQAAGREIVERWADAIHRDIAEHPFSAEDLQVLNQRAQHELAANALLAYGATLLVTAVTPDRVYVLQLGDGDIVFVALDGTAWLPLPPDDRIAGNETTSLCMPRAWEDMRFGVSERRNSPRLVLLSTDGYANSFQSEKAFLQVGADLLGMIVRGGIEAVGREIEQWLRETTEQGAGDDVTLTVLDVTLPPGEGAATAPPAPQAALRTVRSGKPPPRPLPPAASPAREPAPAPVTVRARAPSPASTGAGVREGHPITLGAPVPPPDFGPPSMPAQRARADPPWRIMTALAVSAISLVAVGWAVFGRGGSHSASGPAEDATTAEQASRSTSTPTAPAAGAGAPGRPGPAPQGFGSLLLFGNCAYLLDGDGQLWVQGRWASSESEGSGPGPSRVPAALPTSVQQLPGPWDELRVTDGHVEVSRDEGASQRVDAQGCA